LNVVNQAVILVGGIGERLRPLTNNIPKPMVEVAGKPFIEHLVLLLKKEGIGKILFLTGYLGNKIKDYFENGSKWDIEIDYSFEENPLGTGGALRLAKEKLHEDFFLLFGDSYLPINYREMEAEYFRNNKKVIVAIYDNTENTNVPFNIIIDEQKKLISIYSKGKDNPPSFNYCDAGVLIVNKSVVEWLGNKTPVSFEESIYPRLIADEEMGYFISTCRFYDIGTIERLKAFEEYIKNRKK